MEQSKTLTFNVIDRDEGIELPFGDTRQLCLAAILRSDFRSLITLGVFSANERGVLSYSYPIPGAQVFEVGSNSIRNLPLDLSKGIVLGGWYPGAPYQESVMACTAVPGISRSHVALERDKERRCFRIKKRGRMSAVGAFLKEPLSVDRLALGLLYKDGEFVSTVRLCMPQLTDVPIMEGLPTVRMASY